jgi:hypothetical protein
VIYLTSTGETEALREPVPSKQLHRIHLAADQAVDSSVSASDYIDSPYWTIYSTAPRWKHIPQSISAQLCNADNVRTRQWHPPMCLPETPLPLQPLQGQAFSASLSAKQRDTHGNYAVIDGLLHDVAVRRSFRWLHERARSAYYKVDMLDFSPAPCCSLTRP